MTHYNPAEILPRAVRNYLSEADQITGTTVGSWTVSSGNANLSLDFEMQPVPDGRWNVLVVTPTDTDPVVLTCNPAVTTIADNTDSMSFSIQVKSTRDLTATLEIERQKGAPPLSVSRTVVSPADRWSVIRSELLYLPQDVVPYYITPTLTFANHQNNPIYLYLPNIYPEYGFRLNTFLREAVMYMPEFLIEQDKAQQFPTYPLLRILDIGSGYAGKGFEQYKEFRFLDRESGYRDVHELKSHLVDPEVAEEEFLPWLASVSGNSLTGDSPTTTPWENFPSSWQDWLTEIDAGTPTQMDVSSISVDGSGTVTVTATSTLEAWLTVGSVVDIGGTTAFNGQFEVLSEDGGTNSFTYFDASAIGASSESTGTIDQVDNSWFEIEGYDLVVANIQTFWRWQIQNRYLSQRAGTLEGLRETVKFFLTDTQSVRITPNYSGAFTIHVETLTSETRDGITGSSAQYILDAINLSKPVGVLATHECVASL